MKNKKRAWVDALPEDLSEHKYMKRICEKAKKWKEELAASADNILLEEMAEQKEKIESALQKCVIEEKVKKEDVLEFLMKVLTRDKTLDEWIKLPESKCFWGSCFRRDLGGRCREWVKYINVLLPRCCEGGNDEDGGGNHALTMYNNTFDENFVCEKHYSLRHREKIYKRIYLPELMKRLKFIE